MLLANEIAVFFGQEYLRKELMNCFDFQCPEGKKDTETTLFGWTWSDMPKKAPN